MRFPGSGYGGGCDWLFEPGAMANLGLALMVILLLWTLARRRTLKGPLQITLILCAVALPLLPRGDEFSLIFWLPHVVTGIGVASFGLSRLNEQMT